MRPKERRDSGQKDLFCARLEQIVDMGHPLAKLARSVDWGFLEACPHIRAPGASVPDGRTIRRKPFAHSRTSAPALSYRLPTPSRP